MKNWLHSTFLTAPVFPDDEVKTLRARMLNNALLTTVALTAFLIPAALLGHFARSIIALEIGMAVTPLLLRRWVFQGRLKLASGALLAVGLIVLTAAIARLGTIRVPAAGFYIALVLAAGLFLEFPGLAVMTGLSSLAVAGLIVAENAGLLPRPNYAVTITQWLATTGFLVCIGWWSYAVLKAFRLSLHRIGQDAAERQSHETRFNLAMEAAHQSWFELDLRTGLVVTSKEYARMLGYDPATFTSTQANWLENIHPEDRPATEEIFRCGIASGQTLFTEYRRRTAAGGWMWLHSVGRVVERDAAGQPVMLSGTHSDISERKRAEQSLRESEARYRLLVDTAPDGIAMHRAGKIIFANAAALRMFGATKPEELVGTPMIERVHPDHRPIALARAQLALGDGQTLPPMEEKFLRLDGTAIDVEVSGGGLILDGQPTVQLFGRDITERKRTEAALREVEGRYRRLVETNFDGCVVHQDGRIVDANSACAKMHGSSVAELIGKPVLELAPPEHRSKVAAAIQQPGSPIFESVGLRKDGTQFPVELAGESCVFQGRPARIVALRDITARKAAELALNRTTAELLQAQEIGNMGSFVYDVASHGVTYSPHLKKLLGLASDRADSVADWREMLHPDDRPAVGTAEKACLEQGVPFDLDYRIIRRSDGQTCWLRGMGKAERDATGRIVRLTGVNIDIAERKRSQIALQSIQTQLAQAMDQAHLANWEMDAATSTFTFNDRFYAIYGTTAEREGGYRMAAEVYAREFIPSDDQHLVPDVVAKMLSGQIEHLQLEHRIRRRDGELRHVIVRVNVVRDPSGRVLGTRGTNQDITDLKRTEEKLRKSEHLLRESQHIAKLGSWDFDLVTQRLEWSEETFVLFDQSPAAFTPSFEAFARFVHPEDRASMQTAFEQALSSDATPFHVTVRVVNATGRPWVLDSFGAVRRDPDGRPLSVFGTVQDVTERIAQEEQLLELLAQSERDAHIKDELLREVNHRVTNNLAAVLGLMAFESEHSPTAAAQVISPVMDRLGQRIRGLLQVHRMLAQSSWAPVRIDQLAEQIIRAALSAASGRKPATILIATSTVKVSPRQAGTFAMVLSELATNTVKHAGASAGEVSVRFETESDAETITMRYHDNGPGYAPEVLQDERSNVGLKLIRELVSGSLRGTVALTNDNGAVTTIRIRQEEETRT